MTERDEKSPDAPVRRDEHEGDGAARGTARMEAFADAVFAIAFTLPVVEIELPEAREPGVQMLDELAHLWPGYLGYLLAVVVIGLYWVHHHFSGAIYRTTSHWFLIATTAFLVMVGFIAYPSRVLAESFTDAAELPGAARFYIGCLALLSLSWFLKWRTGRDTGHLDARLDPAYVSRLDRRYAITSLLMVTAFVLSLALWWAGLALAALAVARIFRAPETPRYLTVAPEIESE